MTDVTRRACFVSAWMFATVLIAAPARPHRVALTFDDLPVHGALPPDTTRSDVTRRLLEALRAHKVTEAYGFINAQGLAGAADHADMLRLWRAAGHPLGNHTFSHLDLHANTVEAFTRDVVANEPTLRTYMGNEGWRWLRFPYLHEGETLEKRRAVARMLGARGYRVAQVTLTFDDWAFSDPYARCAGKNDTATLTWIRSRFLERADRELAADLVRARRVFGRDIPHILLLHAGAVQAVMLPELLTLLEVRGFEFITLEDAQRDPAYARDPGRAFPAGATWLDQMSVEKGLSARHQADDTLERLASACR